MLISVIVPVYNAEYTLRRCVDSILSQSFTDLELLLVDDGSKDGSLAICEKYALLDSRVKVIHKENGGVSSARNMGLDVARGEWVCFVDSDDYIGLNYFPTLLNYNMDLYLQHWVFEVDGVEIVKEDLPSQVVEEKDICRFMSDNLQHFIFKSPCAKFYKRKIIGDNGLYFNNHYRIGEDCLFNIKYYQFVNAIEVLEKGTYKYCREDDDDGYKAKYHLNIEESTTFLKQLLQLYRELPFRCDSFLDGERQFYKSMCLGGNPLIKERFKWITNKTVYDLNCELRKYNTPYGRVRQAILVLLIYANSILSKVS